MAEVERPVHSSFSDLQGAESRACGKSTSTYYHVCLKPLSILAGMCLDCDPDLGVTAVLREQGPMDTWKLD